jgi:ERCC4-type nuclease
MAVNGVATITAPFTICVDSREQAPYSFTGFRAGFARGNPPVIVPTMRVGLPNGDYSLLGYPSIAIERKSKSDLYGSVARRANFIGRLERMSELCRGPLGGQSGYAAVVVEAELLDLINHPPRFSNLHPRSMSRTLIAWSIRYPVRWFFLPGREAGELLTYRLLERYFIDRKNGS